MIAAPLALVLEEIVPQGAVAQEIVQLTPLWLGSLPTVAVMFGTVPAAAVEGVSGATDSVTDGTVIVIAKVFVVSSREVALMVTVASLPGGVAGPV